MQLAVLRTAGAGGEACTLLSEVRKPLESQASLSALLGCLCLIECSVILASILRLGLSDQIQSNAVDDVLLGANSSDRLLLLAGRSVSPFQCIVGSSQTADRIDIQSLDDGGHEQPIATLGDGLEGHGEDSLDG